jgi:hypothetical protein
MIMAPKAMCRMASAVKATLTTVGRTVSPRIEIRWQMARYATDA